MKKTSSIKHVILQTIFTLMIITNEAILKVNAEVNNESNKNVTVIKVEPTTTISREQKQLHVPWAVLSEGTACLTSKNTFGFCTSFRNCYPYIKLPDLTIWEAWLLGNYDTCTYFNSIGRQLFGVCCTTSPTIPSSQDTTIVDAPPNQENQISDDTYKTDEQSQDSKHQNWPLPVIQAQQPPWLTGMTTTRRPVSIMQWPPPVPTHPPDHHYPTHPPPQFPPLITSTTTTSTSRPQTTRPTSIPWPPPIPTHPPISTRPPSSSTSSPFDTTLVGDGFQATCGAKNGNLDQERIVGGQNASPHEWPWIVVLFNSGRQFCGGSLIDDVHVLTAAHCVFHMTSWDVARVTAHLGDHNIRSNTEVRHVERKVKRVVRHKGFDFMTLHNDVALLTLDRPVTFTNMIRPICLPSVSGKAYTGKTGIVAGWGSLRENGPQPAVLQKVSIPIWSNEDCARKYGIAAPAGIISSMICAGKAAKDSCSGDSGGPLMVNEGSQWIQVGIVSWGIGCGKGQYPGVYTRVSSFMPWIMKNKNTK